MEHGRRETRLDVELPQRRTCRGVQLRAVSGKQACSHVCYRLRFVFTASRKEIMFSLLLAAGKPKPVFPTHLQNLTV